MQSPTTTHWTAAKRILRYLKFSITHGLLYKPGALSISAYSDADYAGDPDNRHSTGGYCVYLGPNLISWSSKSHKTVSRSSAEAEYRQLALTAAEISWLRSLFLDLGLFLTCPRIWCDNVSAIALASNPVFHGRTKHIEVDYHYVREKVVHQELQVFFISSTNQIADIFTKGLPSPRFQFLLSKLPVLTRPISLRGDDKPRLSLTEVN
jgi:histone deacetylase 1/2